jgi:hypothetical protein
MSLIEKRSVGTPCNYRLSDYVTVKQVVIILLCYFYLNSLFV